MLLHYIMPKVFNAKFDAFMKSGFRAILMDDAETKQAEEKMTDSLVKGLKAMDVLTVFANSDSVFDDHVGCRR